MVKILIKDSQGGGYYSDRLAGMVVKAVKKPSNPELYELYKKSAHLFKTKKDKAIYKAGLNVLLEWHIRFSSNPKVKKIIAKGDGFNPKWKGITCPIWLATEV